MYDKVNFDVTPEQLTFNTQVNGDKIVIIGIEFSADDAAAMAYLINQPKSLEVKIKIKD
jgi:hypothetical protein